MTREKRKCVLFAVLVHFELELKLELELDYWRDGLVVDP